VYIHATFWILPLIVLFQSWSAGGPPAAIFSLTVLGAAMACVILHEFGHALMARHFGIRTRDITLYPIGGVARLERLSEKPVGELLIALAGPAVNVVIAILLAGVLAACGVTLIGSAFDGSPIIAFLLSLLAINVLLVIFNMIPAFPMDGGRVLRALLAMNMDRLRATEIAAKIGVVMAILIGASFPLLGPFVPFFNNPMLLLVAAFVLLVGQGELAMVRHQEAMRRAEPIDVLPVRPIGPTMYDVTGQPIQPGFSGFIWDSRLHAWVQWRDGRPVATFGAGSE
jgi:Zn-dependent protease